MRFRHRVFVLVIALLLPSVTAPGVKALTEEEQYFQEIVSLLIAADFHLANASDALTDCLATFQSCLANPSAVVKRLNTSRDGLVAVGSDVSILHVPDRYSVVNQLVTKGIAHSINGTSLHIEGLQETSLAKFEAGSALTSEGRDELQQAVDFLHANPPGSPLAQILLFLLIAIGISLAGSVLLIVRWYRKEVRRRSSPPRRKETA